MGREEGGTHPRQERISGPRAEEGQPFPSFSAAFTVQGSPVHVQEPLPGAMTVPAPSPRPAAAADPPQRS